MKKILTLVSLMGFHMVTYGAEFRSNEPDDIFVNVKRDLIKSSIPSEIYIKNINKTLYIDKPISTTYVSKNKGLKYRKILLIYSYQKNNPSLYSFQRTDQNSYHFYIQCPIVHEQVLNKSKKIDEDLTLIDYETLSSKIVDKGFYTMSDLNNGRRKQLLETDEKDPNSIAYHANAICSVIQLDEARSVYFDSYENIVFNE